jgi:hypothetical protein
MKLKLISQAFLAGLVVVSVFAGSTLGLSAALQRLLPDLLDGIASLVFGPIAFILVFLVGLVLSIGSGLWLLRAWPVKTRVFIILAGGVITAVCFVALLFAFPSTNRYLLVGASAFIGGIVFIAEAVLSTTHVVYRLLISLLLLACGAWVASVQYNSGFQRVQLEGLKQAGFSIYIPAATADAKVQYIAPANDKYDGYKDGVNVYLTDGARIDEQKVDHRPAADCGEPFIRSENGENTCRLVASKNGVDVYLLESKSYASYYNDTDIRQSYFAVAGDTWIYTSDSLVVHSVVDPTAQSTPEQIQAFEGSKARLLDLEPLTDLSAYISKR